MIVAINGRPVQTEADYSAAIDASPAVLRLSVRNVRSGQIQELVAQLGGHTTAAPRPRPVFGARVRDNAGDGVLIAEIVAGSPADRAGLEGATSCWPSTGALSHGGGLRGGHRRRGRGPALGRGTGATVASRN